MKINLKEFAITGNFGPIKLGMTKADLINSFSKPDDDNNYGTGYGGVNYGMYEFFYQMELGRITGIQNDHYDPEYPGCFVFKNDSFELDSWFFEANRDYDLKGVSGILTAEQLEFKIEKYLDRKIIVMPSGFVIDFDNEIWNEQTGKWEITANEENSKLIGFRYFEV